MNILTPKSKSGIKNCVASVFYLLQPINFQTIGGSTRLPELRCVNSFSRSATIGRRLSAVLLSGTIVYESRIIKNMKILIVIHRISTTRVTFYTKGMDSIVPMESSDEDTAVHSAICNVFIFRRC